MFKTLVDIYEEFEQIDQEYTNDIWFGDIDQKVFFFKHKLHNWLKEDEKEHKRDHSSRSSTRKSSVGEIEGSRVNCRSFFHEEKKRC